ncbi:MAG: DNA-processing protein DprA [Armatimonadota bacterium]|nr:MAG: DNA-processing protein DprA [Armatimonadota bacterium]
MTEREAWLALNAAELPPRTTLDLLDHYGTANALISAKPSAVASAARLTPTETARFAEAQQRDYRADLEKLAKLRARLITIRDAEYPPHLRHIYDSPPVLFVRGSLQPCDERAIAIVGTRRVTAYGRLVSETLGRDLAARGITVVSGMAVGADAAAHRGALSAGGRTIGILACGIDVLYPRDTLELREQAVVRGAVISEVPLGTPARPPRFPARNRLISGLSLGVVVTEAPERSGALLTANHAANQGRQVFAVPGSVNSEFSRGTHALLRDGARLVESVEDILDELSLPDLSSPPASEGGAGEQTPAVSELTGDERTILDALSLHQKHVDDVIHECHLPSSRASGGLLMLELKGLVRRLPGNMFMRVR